MAKIGARRRRVYEDRGARISRPGGRRPPRPDTLKQTDQPPISTKPLADGAAHTFSTISAHSGHRIGSRRELFTALLFARLYRRRIKLYQGLDSEMRRSVIHSRTSTSAEVGGQLKSKSRVCLRRRSSKRHLSEGPPSRARSCGIRGQHVSVTGQCRAGAANGSNPSVSCP